MMTGKSEVTNAYCAIALHTFLNVIGSTAVNLEVNVVIELLTREPLSVRRPLRPNNQSRYSDIL